MKRWRFLCAIAWALTMFSHPAPAQDADRQAEVEGRGAEVMPFSLAKTQHQFTKTESGGIQRVISLDPKNQEQIRLIRQHLKQMAENFKRGDYTGPESIHGPDMPALAEMRSARHGSLQITYLAEPSGASLTFHANNARLIKAIHEWFDAQVQDHGHDAMEMHCLHHP
jgi:hypothetical protein